MNKTPRVRFAPSPTGFMHLGNVRAALMNYLYAKKHNGTFVLRIEDTDAARDFEEARQRIISDLAWLGLTYQEGPEVGGDFGPYLQSERTAFYAEKLTELVNTNRAYRCFCTPEQLDEKRKAQLAAGKPPRYDRACLHLPADKIKRRVETEVPFIWRFKINDQQALSIKTLQGSSVDFDMQHFSDFALTRSDGSFTFVFVNFVDDWLMNITHVIRGEDHLTNTALQAALYDAFMIPAPTFWHLPMICNAKGEKLSKRDFGFSLGDLRDAGFLPQAITNYLAIMGTSYPEEVKPLHSLPGMINFEKLGAHGGIHYDLEKLRWINLKWMSLLEMPEFIQQLDLFVKQKFPGVTAPYTTSTFESLLHIVKKEAYTLPDAAETLRFYFEAPSQPISELEAVVPSANILVIKNIFGSAMKAPSPSSMLELIKQEAKTHGIQTKELFTTLRFALTGACTGMNINDLFSVLDVETIRKRLGRI